MGYKPTAGYRGAGGFRPGGGSAPAEDDSLFWKAMELLNRPSSATFGAATALAEGGDPLERAMRALRGEREYSGTDLLTAMGADPESWLTKGAGFGLTVLNPMDPLNYIGGLGVATKAGRGARLLGTAATKWDDAARAGERALLSFAGHRVPIPGDAAVLGGMQRAGNAFMDTTVGKGLQQLFGGRKGPLASMELPETARAVFDLEDEAGRIGKQFTMETDPELKALAGLKGEDKGGFLEAIGRTYRGGEDMGAAREAFVRAGESGAEARAAAWDAADRYMGSQKEFLGRLEGTGMDAYALPMLGHFPRLPVAKEGVEASGLGAKVFEERFAALQGPSKNEFNRVLLPGSIEPVGVQTLTKAGREEFFRMGGRDVFDALEREDPQFVAEFLRKHRMTPAELNAAPGLAFAYETDPVVAFKKMRDDAIANVRGDELIRLLEKQGIARPWDEGAHAMQVDDGRYVFAKVDQGRYAERPLAVPAEYAEALRKMTTLLSPGPDKAALGSMLNQALPDMLKNAGLMQWWKAASIFGGGPSYFVRNGGTGIIKNYYEGLTAWNPQTYRFYPEAVDLVGRQLRGKWGDAVVELGGVRVSKERLWQEYVVRGLAGGGLPDVDIMTAGAGKSRALREKVFAPARKINEQVEMFVRMPLVLKQLEDTFAAARAAGEIVPDVVGPLAKAGADVADLPVVTKAFDNAAAQVFQSHFDYNDLSPTEERLRNFWVPFYCVPTDHEILTKEGWKTYDQLEKGEMVMGYDVNTRELRWEPLIDVAVFDYDGDLCRFGLEGSNHEFLFTKDHRWPVEVARQKVKGMWFGGERRILRAYQLNTSHKIPRVGDFTATESVLSPRHARILGWIVTDGYFRWRKKSHLEAMVYQSPHKYLDEIVELLGTKPRKPHPETGVVCVPVLQEDVRVLKRVFRGKADMPGIVCGLSREAAEAMWDAMFKAEGYSHPQAGMHFAQVHGPVLEAFQILCTLTGRHAHIGDRGCYVNGQKFFAPRNSHGAKTKYYKGKIWCPKTPTHTWVMRHDGATIFSGNTWMRKNIPHETVNMIQRPGQYLPFARAYYQRFKDAGMTPEDLPEWMGSNFAVPAGQADDGRNQFLDMTGFLPFMDVMEFMDKAVGRVQTGESRASEIARYLATRSNPFLVQMAEQGLQGQFLTGREYGETPGEMFGATMSPSAMGLANLFRPARELDRLNPGGAFTMLGNTMGTFEGDVRPRRNEPDEAERWARFGLGLKIYGVDPDQANLSRAQREKSVKRYRGMAKRAEREGRTGEAAYFESKAAELEP